MEHRDLQVSTGETLASDSGVPTKEQQDGDPFDNLLTLEDEYYQEGYNLGVADGSRAGRIEGRIFGMEKGFEKFIGIGQLAGRGQVWAARLPVASAPRSQRTVVVNEGSGRVPLLTGSERLRRHIDRLVELTDPESLDTRNTEDSVNECDERLAGARAKAILIERVVGEDKDGSSLQGGSESRATEVNVAHSPLPAKNLTAEMEDFSGLPQARGRKTT